MAGASNADLRRIVVLAGGISHERDVSLRSGRRVADSLRAHGLEVELVDPDATLLRLILDFFENMTGLQKWRRRFDPAGRSGATSAECSVRSNLHASGRLPIVPHRRGMPDAVPSRVGIFIAAASTAIH